MGEVNKRIEALRKVMREHGFSAYIITSSDAHLSEYAPEHWLGREWISGFTGSAGTVVVTLDWAGLWTDSRYYLQATKELEGTGIELMKQGLPNVPTIENYLGNKLKAGDIVASDGACLSAEDARSISAKLATYALSLQLDVDLLDKVWNDRPSIPTHPIFLQSPQYSGQTTQERIASVRTRLAECGAGATIVNMLCELAWVFNIRGTDVTYNPVAIGFAYISQEEAILFINRDKLSNVEVEQALHSSGLTIRPYEDIDSFLSHLPHGTRLYVDPKRTTYRLYNCLPKHVCLMEGVSLLTQMKAIKNPTELAGLRRAMVRDGVALTRFFIWLEDLLASGGSICEYDLGVKLSEFRAKGEGFYGDSFGTIAGYLGHGAIVHYKAEPESSYIVREEGVLLLDSGGQYVDGTTDITRTIALSKPSDRLRDDYTLVLKGHIAIAQARYPEGTCGCQLDILARKALWESGLNYGHGTGHGIGHFLNVHEGPQNIRTDLNPTPLEIGMVTSNEPGLYRTDEYGIRIENLVVTQLEEETVFGRFFSFETVTLCYLDNTLVNKELLTDGEIAWYNAYQARVYDSLAPVLNEAEALWLKAKTQAI